ncbi:hypothetical protein IMZ48_26720 [Candidatus Bathyarchaeota archaeon]|nr:hypothetical protein [Candidatus Bathyarchaeota archaeon]
MRFKNQIWVIADKLGSDDPDPEAAFYLCRALREQSHVVGRVIALLEMQLHEREFGVALEVEE